MILYFVTEFSTVIHKICLHQQCTRLLRPINCQTYITLHYITLQAHRWKHTGLHCTNQFTETADRRKVSKLWHTVTLVLTN